MKMPTAEEVELAHKVAGSYQIAGYMLQFATLLRQSSEGTDMMQVKSDQWEADRFIGKSGDRNNPFNPWDHCRHYEQLYKASVAQTIEECAKACESVYESYESKCDTWPEARPDALSGAEDCIRAIRELKEGK